MPVSEHVTRTNEAPAAFASANDWLLNAIAGGFSKKWVARIVLLNVCPVTVPIGRPSGRVTDNLTGLESMLLLKHIETLPSVLSVAVLLVTGRHFLFLLFICHFSPLIHNVKNRRF